MLNRRVLLTSVSGLAAGMMLPAAARSVELSRIEKTAMRGAIDVTEMGVRPGALDDQSKAFATMLQAASDRDTPLFLPPGVYLVSNLAMPKRVRLTGVPGASRIVYGGDGYLFAGEGCEHVELEGVVFDGANRWLDDHVTGVLDFRDIRHVSIQNCQVTGSGKTAIALERVGGRIERCEISGAADVAIYAVEGRGMSIVGNTIRDCANGGILVHRWQIGEDGTIVTGNRIERIGARAGGTGQHGNGINVFRAGNVIVSGNMVSDCAFTAVRANSASNIQISQNTCLRSGETGIYSEFSFEGAVISANIVDGAANGISVVNFNEGGRMATCTGNLVRNLKTTGPYTADPPGFGNGISIEADCAATGNVIEDAPLHGMNIGWGEFMRNVVATGNVIRKTGTGIAVTVVEGTGSAVISDNLIEAARDGGIVGFRWTEAVTGDLALAGVDAFANLTIERNRVS
ncbi:MAG: TIGR03808 family TAT-translocated repetitive protein [Rhizobiaceae bacterium]|nr:TIGR03808 family TAT-translocated repetitive protein [Rhizobiaceae bacterium]